MQNTQVPFGPGKVIGRTFSLMKKNFGGLLLFSLPTGIISFLPVLLILPMFRRFSGLMNYLVNSMAYSQAPDLSFFGAWLLRNIVPLILLILVWALVSTAVSFLVIPFMNCSAQRFMGRREGPNPLSPKEAMASMKGNYGKTIVLALVAVVYSMVVSMAISLVSGFIQFFTVILMFIPIIGWFFILVIGLALIAAAFLSMIPVMLIYPVAVFEDKWGFDALTRSFRLVFGQPKIALLSGCLFGLIMTGASILLGIPSAILSTLQSVFHISMSTVVVIPLGIVVSVLTAVGGMLVYILETAYGFALHEKTVQAEAFQQFAQPGRAPYVPVPAAGAPVPPPSAPYAPVPGDGEEPAPVQEEPTEGIQTEEEEG